MTTMTFTYIAADFTVTKAMLTVTANSQTKVYGAANPSLTLTYSGFVNGDDADDLTTKPVGSTTVNLLTAGWSIYRSYHSCRWDR